MIINKIKEEIKYLLMDSHKLRVDQIMIAARDLIELVLKNKGATPS